MSHFFRNNGLSIVMLGLFFAVFIFGQIGAGRLEYNEDLRKAGRPPLGYLDYLRSPHFGEATAENWESEFLQMGVFVVATACLYQKGSAASKDPRKAGQEKEETLTARSPWPVRRGGWPLRFYRHSLSIALFGLFLVAFAWHGVAGHKLYNEQRQMENEPTVSLPAYLRSSRFWFESLQNWQSEFLSIGLMVLLSIWLRETGSSESKSVETPHEENED